MFDYSRAGAPSRRTDFTSPQEGIAAAQSLRQMAESVYSGNPAVTHRRWDERQGGVKVEMTIITRANHTWIGYAATRLQSQFAASL